MLSDIAQIVSFKVAITDLVKVNHDAAEGSGYWTTHFAYAEGCSYVPVRASLGTPVELRIL